jgi:Gas vesicle synthesis protein GvpL/GvpF
MKKGPLPQTRKALSGRVAKSVFCRCRSARAAAAAGGQDASNVVWVYAVTSEVDTEQLSGVTGVAGEPVRAVTEAGLSAVVGTVGGPGHGDKPLTRLLVGLTAIETAGRAHHQVITSLAEDSPVLPVRLATVYPDDATIRRQLAQRHADLAVMVESFRGTQEWGVKVYVDTYGSLPSQEPLWVQAEACADEIAQALSDVAVAIRHRPPPDPRFGADSGWMVLNGAYLLEAERAGEFAEVVASVTAEHAAVRADVTGPWPPYSFADRHGL